MALDWPLFPPLFQSTIFFFAAVLFQHWWRWLNGCWVQAGREWCNGKEKLIMSNTGEFHMSVSVIWRQWERATESLSLQGSRLAPAHLLGGKQEDGYTVVPGSSLYGSPCACRRTGGKMLHTQSMAWELQQQCCFNLCGVFSSNASAGSC